MSTTGQVSAIREVASDVWRALVAHWITALIIAGVSLGLPLWGKASEQWSWPAAIAVGVVVMAALLSILRRSPRGRVYENNAAVTLRIHADERKPTGVSMTNIGRWFTLEFVGLQPGPAGAPPQRVISHTLLLVTFDPWITVGSPEVQGHNMVLPHYVIQKADSDAAIVIFDGKLPPGELEFKVTP